MRILHTLHWQIILAYTALILCSLTVISVYLIDFVSDTYLENLEKRSEYEAILLSETAAHYFAGSISSAELQAISVRIGDRIDARVTIIANDGTVLADSWEGLLLSKNDGTRQEVMEAKSVGIGKNTDISSTGDTKMLYVAVPIEIDGAHVAVSRVAVPISQIQSNVNHIIATISLSTIVVAILSITLGYYIANKVSRSVRLVTEAAKQLESGNLPPQVAALGYDETRELAVSFNRMALSLRDTINDLSTERTKLAAVLNTMADGVVLLDSDGHVTLMNQAAEELLNISGKETEGNRFIEIVRDHELQQLIFDCLDTEELHYGEVELLRPRRTLRSMAIPISSEGSSGVLLTFHDLTSVKQIHTTRREFVSNVSHELRSPLSAIKALVETLEDGALTDEKVAGDFIKRIHRDIDRMSAMVEDLLQLSRLETGQIPLDMKPVDVRSVFKDVLEQFQNQATANQIELNISIPQNFPMIVGDEQMIRQVLVNLVDNALKFTNEKGSVTISAKSDGGLAEISVADNGLGISEEHTHHIFERFYKADRSRGYDGTGLGLAIVKHIVDAHGGEASVKTQEGQGSTFSFTLNQSGL